MSARTRTIARAWFHRLYSKRAGMSKAARTKEWAKWRDGAYDKAFAQQPGSQANHKAQLRAAQRRREERARARMAKATTPTRSTRP